MRRSFLLTYYTAQTMAHVYPQASLLLLLLHVIIECKADSPVTVPVSAYKGADLALPCFNSTVVDPKSCYRVRLVKYDADAGQKVIFAWPTRNQDATRVKWKQTSLYLTDVRNHDEGLYSCEVCKGWECMLVKNISLKVKDCKASPPVKAALGSAIQLNCSVEKVPGSQGPKNISWVMLKGGIPVSVNPSSNGIKVIHTSLVISSFGASDSGWYRCQYMLGQTRRCYDINLLVQVEKANATTVPVMAATTQRGRGSAEADSRQGSKVAFTAIVVGTVMMALLIGLFLYCRRTNLTVTQPAQTRPAGAVQHSLEGYETVDLTESEDSSVQQLNSLYEHYANEGMRTFQH